MSKIYTNAPVKKHIFTLLVAFIAVFSLNLQARTCTAIVNNGPWSNPTTWSCNSVPSNNDTLWIPLGITVSVDINSPTYSSMLIVVDGNLNFENGQKINLACGSSLYLSATGFLLGGTPGSKINVCGTTVWNGPGPTGGVLTFGSPVLPIELISFSAEVVNDAVVELTWITAKEVNNDYFTIERSTDGVSFETILRVDGSGNTTENKTYRAVDAQPVKGTAYYRLRQTDFNGQSESFNIVAVNFQAKNANRKLILTPNPCSSQCNITLSGSTTKTTAATTVYIYDAVGMEVFSAMPVAGEQGNFTLELNVGGMLKPGVYVVRTISGNETISQKLIVN
jgi:hypothetical protein